MEWAAKTHDLLERLWKLPISGQLGISLIPAVRLGTAPWPPVWRHVVFGCTGDHSYTHSSSLHTCPEMAPEEVRGIGRLQGEHTSGTRFLTFTAEPVRWHSSRSGQGGTNVGMSRLLPYLLSQFEAAGGEVVIKHVAKVTIISTLAIFQHVYTIYISILSIYV